MQARTGPPHPDLAAGPVYRPLNNITPPQNRGPVKTGARLADILFIER
jgi:hypothetical protein